MTQFTLHCGNWLEILGNIPDGSIDAIITDLPYGKTNCKWDKVIPFEPMWKAVNVVLKPNGVFITTSRQPFTSELIVSNLVAFVQTWVWDKKIGVNFMNAKRQHLQGFEDICVFCNGQPTYNPQMEYGKPFKDNRITQYRTSTEALGSRAKYVKQDNQGTRYPKGIIRFSGRNNKPVHPTQKPVMLYEYLIRTYTNENETVADFCMGSGTTGVACASTNRKFIGVEMHEPYFKVAKTRIKALTNDISTG